MRPIGEDAGSDASARQRVYIIDGKRTPFLKARGRPGPFTTVELAAAAGAALLLENERLRGLIDEVILGCGAPPVDAPNPARDTALRIGLGETMPAFSVQRNCGSGMQSIDTAFRYIQSGYAECILAGGADSLSHAPILFSKEAVHWFADWRKARNAAQRWRALMRFRPRFFAPEIGVEKGLTDSVVQLNMGQTAEVLRHEWRISRRDADAYALQSHQRLDKAQRDGRLQEEIASVFDTDGAVYETDDGVRADTTMERLAELKPSFEPPYGDVTAGNSSQVTDGACWVLVASERIVDMHGLSPLGEIIDSDWAALDPRRMGLGPLPAMAPIIRRRCINLDDIDLWEINEAFAHQVLACLKALADEEYCRGVLGLEGAFGEIDRSRLNVDGGAVSLGHPVGASGARIVLHALNALKRRAATQAIATECIGGGQGGAMLLKAA